MKKKTSIVALLVLLVCSSIFAQRYDDESDFRAIPIDNGRSVRIIRYVGRKQVVNIPPRMHGKPVSEIAEAVFRKTDITSVSIPRDVTSIGKEAFRECENLSTVSFASGSRLQSIGDFAFFMCESLTDIIIPEGVTSIGTGTFGRCFGLTSIAIPEGVTFISAMAFASCYGLTNIAIPKSLTTIGDGVFASNRNLTVITVEAGNPQYTGEGGILWNKAKTEIVAFPSARGAITIPEDVMSIGNFAFYECLGLTSITIPESVTSIGNAAFESCSGLTSITIPASVTSIGLVAFGGWASSQRVNVRGHANRASADRAWGTEWRQNGNATIVYGR